MDADYNCERPHKALDYLPPKAYNPDPIKLKTWTNFILLIGTKNGEAYNVTEAIRYFDSLSKR